MRWEVERLDRPILSTRSLDSVVGVDGGDAHNPCCCCLNEEDVRRRRRPSRFHQKKKKRKHRRNSVEGGRYSILIETVSMSGCAVEVLRGPTLAALASQAFVVYDCFVPLYSRSMDGRSSPKSEDT
jgi:hypothetical protein